jgi:hypothetical protein
MRGFVIIHMESKLPAWFAGRLRKERDQEFDNILKKSA